MNTFSHRVFKYSKCFSLQLICLYLAISFCSCSKEKEPEKELPSLGDVTEQVVLLGNPLNQKYKDNTEKVYARNIWDMHAFNNKIYFGGGNSSNYAPAVNAGPAELWTYEPSSQTFTKEFTVDDEQIHRIREFDNELYIPGHDARESWVFGNFYRLETGGWKKYRTIPNGVHVYDIYKWKNKLFAALGPNTGTTSVVVSEDNGNSWSNIVCPGYNNSTTGNCLCVLRVYTLVLLADTLYTDDCNFYYSGEGNTFIRPPKVTKFFYKDIATANRVERPVIFNKQTVYIAGKIDNDHQYLPLALMRAQSHVDVSRINLPEGALPRDILVLGNWMAVLVSTKINNTSYRNAVLLASDISSETIEWKEAFNFTATTFARSFEYLNGVFYFGLGCETDLLTPETGNILSVDYEGL